MPARNIDYFSVWGRLNLSLVESVAADRIIGMYSSVEYRDRANISKIAG